MINVFIVLLLVVLTACSANDDYLQAQTLPPVTVPEGLDKEALGQIYQVPEGDGRLASGELAKPLPPTLSGRQRIADPRVQRYGNQSWVVLPKNAASTWSQLLIYLRSRRIQVVTKDPINATVDTGWIIEAAEPGTAVRYQIRLEGGLQSDLTEIHATNIKGNLQTVIRRSTQWPSIPEDTNHKNWMLKDIARSISSQRKQGDSIIASSISFPAKAVASTVAGEPIIEIAMDAGRSYASVLNALSDEESGFAVFEDSAAEQVIYFRENTVKKATQEKKPLTKRLVGFLGNIATAKTGRDNDAKHSLAQLLDNLPDEEAVNTLFPNRVSGQDKLGSRSGFLLVQRTVDGKQSIYVRDAYGRPLKPAKAKVLLDNIKQRLF